MSLEHFESGLTEESLSFVIANFAQQIDDMALNMVMRPTKLIVPPSMLKLARRIVFPHHILKRRKGARGRAMTLKWRRK